MDFVGAVALQPKPNLPHIQYEVGLLWLSPGQRELNTVRLLESTPPKEVAQM